MNVSGNVNLTQTLSTRSWSSSERKSWSGSSTTHLLRIWISICVGLTMQSSRKSSQGCSPTRRLTTSLACTSSPGRTTSARTSCDWRSMILRSIISSRRLLCCQGTTLNYATTTRIGSPGKHRLSLWSRRRAVRVEESTWRGISRVRGL